MRATQPVLAAPTAIQIIVASGVVTRLFVRLCPRAAAISLATARPRSEGAKWGATRTSGPTVNIPHGVVDIGVCTSTSTASHRCAPRSVHTTQPRIHLDVHMTTWALRLTSRRSTPDAPRAERERGGRWWYLWAQSQRGV